MHEVWGSALTAESNDTRDKRAARFKVPPPWLFSVGTVETSLRYYINYLRTREFLQNGAMNPSIFDTDDFERGFSAQEWKDILYGNYVATGPIAEGVASSAVAKLQCILPGKDKVIVDAKTEEETRPRKKQRRGNKATIITKMSVEG